MPADIFSRRNDVHGAKVYDGIAEYRSIIGEIGEIERNRGVLEDIFKN